MTKLKKWLIENRYSIKNLSEIIGVSLSTTTRIVNSSSEARLAVAIAIEEFTKGEVTIKDLIRTKNV